MGGVRGVLHYMQRTAVQGTPDVITALGGRWIRGSRERAPGRHPFRIAFGDLVLGERCEVARGRPALLVRPLGQCGPILLDRGQAQIVEHQREPGRINVLAHAASPRPVRLLSLSSAS